MIDTIIIIRPRRFSTRDYHRFGIETFMKNGFKVKVIDISGIVNVEIANKENVKEEVTLDIVEKVSHKRNAMDVFESFQSNVFVLLMFPFSINRYWIIRSLNKSAARIGVFFANEPISIEKSSKKKISYYVKMIKNYSFSGIFQNLLNILNQKFAFTKFLMKPVDMVIVGGKKQLHGIPYKISNKTTICWTHTLDYDIYLSERDKSTKTEPIAVFLDQYLPFHPDRMFGKNKMQIDPNYYYKNLNDFFDLIEKKMGLKVVIAAHPRSDYSNKDYFSNRQIIYEKTSLLIKKSALVIAHNSTALNFAILYKKPIIFIKLKQMKNDKFNIYIDKYASLLGKEVRIIDDAEENDIVGELKINDDCYESFISNNIKTKHSKEKFSWEIVCDELKKL